MLDDGDIVTPASGELVTMQGECQRLQAEVERQKNRKVQLSSDLAAVRSKVQKLKQDGEAASALNAEDITVEAGAEASQPAKGEEGCASMVISDGGDVVENMISEESQNEGQGAEGRKTLRAASTAAFADKEVNVSVVLGSVITKGYFAQGIVWTLAIGGVVFVLAAKSLKLGAPDDEGAHRRLGGGASPLMTNIAFCLTAAGLIAFILNFLKQPLILGYLLGGVLVGPIGLDIVHSHEEIGELSSLGLIFLLFMIGLELDISGIFKMGRVVTFSGLLQFPICAGLMIPILNGLENAGFSFGTGSYTTLYCGLSCALSSTMIVVQMLSEQAEMDSRPGRLTAGILIFQDVWAIGVLAVQPDLASLEVEGVFRTFGMIACLIVVALAYAKFVMPAVLLTASKSVELMLIMALSWCFFMCCLAVLPFVGLSMQLASLISGVALATFPYSAEFNGKIKFIRDFFITLFFMGLGMQIHTPTLEIIGKALALSALVLASRWAGIFVVVLVLGGEPRLAALSTINLSQLSELTLVICNMGVKSGHISEETLAIIIWAFLILTASTSYVLMYNHKIYKILAWTCRKTARLLGVMAPAAAGAAEEGEDETGESHDRSIILLGFHKIAAMLIAHFEHHSPTLLQKLHVIDFNENIVTEIRKRGVTCTIGDISSAEVLERSFHGTAQLVICTIPDSMLRGVSNLKLLEVSKQVWPEAHVIVTADNQVQARQLYDAGADYVLRMAKLCAERLHDLVTDHTTHLVHRVHGGDELARKLFEVYKGRDKDHNPGRHITVS